MLLLLLLLTGCAAQQPTKTGLSLSAVAVTDLPGWASDASGKALAAFRRSCAGVIRAAGKPKHLLDIGSADSWRAACAAADRVSARDNAAARRFFETYFNAYALGMDGARSGLLTGYYEPELKGSRRPTPRYATPLYGRPDDLITVDLGKFRSDLQGRRIAGRLKNGRLSPYSSRAEIARGALSKRGLELLWVDDPVAAFFLQVQGSGRVRLPDGTVLRVSYAGDNGHAYVSIGRELVRRGVMPAEKVSLDSIRGWIAAHPNKARGLLDRNPSYVFFRELPPPAGGWPPEAGPSGAAGVPLMPGRSLAVDDAMYPYGLPMWIDGVDPLNAKQPLRRLTVAQDTGGALSGALRGDLFWGHGRMAERRAGRMRNRASYYVLLPKPAAQPRANLETGGDER